MKKQKLVFRCNTKSCHNETKHTMASADYLMVEIVECPECKRLIAFNTLYPPKGFIRKSVNLT